ncbi:50S ribosomal protein L44e [archaeon]|jgi:large subunit ribosomal protein L44e|nr:50S ribosomal protein L44e [archaeon]MBT3577615.1 50S ribosomal protein L44e [archaeon]MBT6820163.1 50S ribosomal protein L44e [archaeon]MBT6956132.1 50S ribosomal protein L44e [archaeon]MBT7025679.1 50S ribosomal protein L44e [archaeon]
MKKPKKTNRYCPFCKKKTEQKVKEPSSGKASTLKRGAKQRARLRGSNRGIGNKGRFSRMKNQAKGKRKTTKKTNIMYTCTVCKKSKYQKKGKRTSKIVIE